jgi:hypothetical protein
MLLVIAWLGVANARLVIGLGGISTKQNPLLYEKIPGFHSCDSKSFPVMRSFFENRVLLDFSRQKTLQHCSLFLNHSNLEMWRKLAHDDAFIRFSINGVVKRLPFIDPSTSGPYIFTEFLFTVSKDGPFQGIVQAQQSYLLKENSTMNIIFSLSSADFDLLSIDSEYVSLAIFVFSVVLLFFVVILICFYRSKFPTISLLHFIDIWRISDRFHTENLISGFGLHFSVSFLIFSALSIFFTMTVPSVIVFSLIGAIASGYVFSSLCTYLQFVQPSRLMSWVSIPAAFSAFELLTFVNQLFSDSFCGLPLWQLVPANIVWLIALSFSYSLGLRMGLGNPVKLPFAAELQRSRSRLFDCFTPSLSVILSFLFVRAAVDHIYEVLLDDYEIDFSLIGAIILMQIGIFALSAIRRTVRKVQSFSGHWQDGHIWPSALLAIFAGLYELADLYGVREISPNVWQSLTISIGALFAIATSIFGISTAAGYYIAIYFVHRLTSKPKPKDNQLSPV